jgi:hypothetical protein
MSPPEGDQTISFAPRASDVAYGRLEDQLDWYDRKSL